MHIQRPQQHSKAISFLTQNNSGSNKVTGGQLASTNGKRENGRSGVELYSHRSKPVNGRQYKGYLPSSSKGVNVNSNYFSPHLKKTNFLSSKSSARDNLSGIYQNGDRGTPTKNSLRERGGIRSQQKSQKNSYRVGAKGATSTVNERGSNQSQYLKTSFLRNNPKTVFNSNERIGDNFFKAPGPHLVHKNQFRPENVYKTRIKTVTPSEIQYTSNKNVYEQLASNSFPKNLRENKTSSHQNKYQIREINPFKKKSILYTANPDNTPESSKQTNTNGLTKFSKHDEPVSKTREFQLGSQPFRNVYENQK